MNKKRMGQFLKELRKERELESGESRKPIQG